MSVMIQQQLPNNPDLNVLNLGVFLALQSLQFQNAPKDVNELIVQTKDTFNKFPYGCLDDVWLMLQTGMNQILDHGSGNNYQIIHMSKRKLEHAGLLPRSIFPMAIHPIFDSDSDGEDVMSLSDNL